jgi:hypothetical protein
VGGGCTLYVVPAVSLFSPTTMAGVATFGLGIPPSPSLVGVEAFLQSVVFDPAGAYQGLLSASGGLQVVIGT